MGSEQQIKYFAYGSNMPLARLQQRVPSAQIVGVYSIKGYDLRFHTPWPDGSAKCNALFTGDDNDCVWGVVFTMLNSERAALDKAESLGVGYSAEQVEVMSVEGNKIEALIYCAIAIDTCSKPYSWYVNHVLTGAEENALPAPYIDKIKKIDYINDNNKARALAEYAVHH